MCRKAVSRAVSLLLAVVLLVGVLPVMGLAAEDSTPPVLIDVTISATTVEVPGEVEIVVEATDDLSGIGSCVAWLNSDDFSREIMVKLSATYWDDARQEDVAYPDGKFHGTTSLNQYLAEKTYSLSIQLSDNAYNYSSYSPNNGTWPADVEPIQLVIKNSNAQDRRFPKLNNVSFSASTVKAPGQVEVIVDATDDLSGLANEGWVSLFCEEADGWMSVPLSTQYWNPDLEQYVAYEDGLLHGTLIIDEYQRGGIYMLDYISVYDNAGNYCTYDREDDSYGVHSTPMSDELKAVQLEVTSDKPHDTTPPVVNDVEMSAATVTVPGQVEVTVDAIDEVAGLSVAYIGFKCNETGEWIEAVLLPGYTDEETEEFVAYEDGKLHGTLTVDESIPAGTYELRYLEVYDNVLNANRFIANESVNHPLYEKLMTVKLVVNAAKNGWVSAGNKWYYYKNGVKLTSQWLEDAGKWYYLDADGVMKTGWISVGGKWYYMDANGIMQTGWLKLDGKWYYLNTSGVMVTGTVTIEGKQHKFNGSGVWQGEVTKSGWVSEGGKWYYYKNGSKVTGWLQDGGKWYYFNASGVMQTGWLKSGSTWYYLQSSGAMATGWVSVGGKWYYMNTSGAMVTGWVKVGSTWYYMNGSGVMHTGWLKLDGKWYYMNTSGVMVTGTVKIDGVTYKFNSSGVWLG